MASSLACFTLLRARPACVPAHAQLPLEMWGHYGAGDKRTLMLHCFDKQHQDPDTFL